MLSILHSSIKHGAFIAAGRYVIAAIGVYLPEGTLLPEELESSINVETETILDINQPLYILPIHREPMAAVFPITSTQDTPVTLGILSKSPLNDVEIGCARLVATALEKELA